MINLYCRVDELWGLIAKFRPSRGAPVFMCVEDAAGQRYDALLDSDGERKLFRNPIIRGTGLCYPGDVPETEWPERFVRPTREALKALRRESAAP